MDSRCAVEEGLRLPRVDSGGLRLGFWVDAADCSIWVAIAYATPIDAEPTDVPEWQVAVEHDFPPWALRQWLRLRRGQEAVRHVFSLIEELITSHRGVMVHYR